MGKMGQNRVFWIYWKIQSIIFSEFGLQRNFILFAYSCTNPIVGKNPEIWAKMLSANQIVGFLN